MTTTATLSSLLRTPNEVIGQLENGDVLITRRDAEPLRLSLARPAEREVGTLSALAQLIAASLDEESVARLGERLIEPFPWVEFLPPDVRTAFIGEFLRTTRACAAVARFDRLTILLNAWRATAEAYADPAVTVDGADLEYLFDDEVAAATDPRAGG